MKVDSFLVTQKWRVPMKLCFIKMACPNEFLSLCFIKTDCINEFLSPNFIKRLYEIIPVRTFQ